MTCNPVPKSHPLLLELVFLTPVAAVVIAAILAAPAPAHTVAEPKGEQPVVFGQEFVEAESLKILGVSPGVVMGVQNMAEIAPGAWSKDAYLFVATTHQGEWVDFALPDEAPGKYTLRASFARHGDFGVITVTVNGKQIGDPIDLLRNEHRTVSAETGPVDIGEVELGTGQNTMRITATGTNGFSVPPHYQFALDAIALIPEP